MFYLEIWPDVLAAERSVMTIEIPAHIMLKENALPCEYGLLMLLLFCSVKKNKGG